MTVSAHLDAPIVNGAALTRVRAGLRKTRKKHILVISQLQQGLKGGVKLLSNRPVPQAQQTEEMTITPKLCAKEIGGETADLE